VDSVVVGEDGRARCPWRGTGDYRAYHDEEWGRPVIEESRLLEKLCLEGFQSGLSWLTILRKRPAFRAAFAGFQAGVLAGFGPADVERLLNDAAIVRHRGKIEATLANARAVVALAETGGSLATLLWSHEPEPPSVPPRCLQDLPSATPESAALAKELRRRGFRFLGPTTVYAAMQACGLVNDHLVDCFVWAEVEAERQALVRPGR
jgi:DNA-3-methyladenine glycosylase I